MTDISQIANKLPGVLTNLQPLGPGIKESPEFPGMPDPCAGPKRMTGVEDILCMKPPTFLPDYKNPCWLDGNTFRCLPYFQLIGMCKSATSDLFKRLHMHPDIIPNRAGKFGKFKMGMTLEEFTNQFFSSKLQTTNTNGNGDPMDFWDRFRESNLPQNTPGADELLWTTPYAVHHVNPNVKLLLMLRDPVDRLYSHYFHGQYGKTAQSFHDHVAPILTSFYIVHLLEWLNAFPREQILIFRNEDYTVDIKGTMTDIFRFLNVDVPNDRVLTQMANMAPFYESKKRKSAGPMLPETKRLLVELYRPYNEQLADFLGDERFAWRDASFATA
ncbi:carbohydrate sulfotransferase 15-like [Dreissena polymorpha]|nr:carbohydrate sulfotransferase 15-like [Dreissena polymorpha]